MRQVFVSSKGEILVEDVPAPIVGHNGLLVRVAYSLISSGTELRRIQQGQGVLQRAFRNADLVKKVVDRVLSKGMLETAAFVRDRLEELAPLGYSASGVVIERGRNVVDLEVGDRVACGGSGYAYHAEIIAVPRNLVVKVPKDVELKEAAFTTLGAIAVQGVRRANAQMGEIVVVIGMGLVGQLVAQLLRVAGCRVIGTDVLPERLALAEQLGAEKTILVSQEDPVKAVLRHTGGMGADAAIICAATSSSEPINQAFQMLRERGRVVIVGAVGMELEREDFYAKELDLLISRSYGPGRYDPVYEEKGVDYPLGYVRWTENRNMAEFVRLLSEGEIDVTPLISAEVPLEEAPQAYRMLLDTEEAPIGIVLTCDDGLGEKVKERRIAITSKPRKKGVINVAIIGAGSFAQRIRLPDLRRISGYNLRAVVTASGVNARQVARRFRAEYCATDYQEVLEDPDVDMVLIATRHNLHFPMAMDAVQAGKDVFVEKPMALTYEQCDELLRAVQEVGIHFTVGFNRRYAPLSVRAKELIAGRRKPLFINYRVNAERIPKDHWVHDPLVGGGRVIGEVCHFLDLFNYFIDNEIIGLEVSYIPVNNQTVSSLDNVAVTLKYADGSLANLVYTSLGDISLPKERIGIFVDQACLVIEDFMKLELYGFVEKGVALKRQDKGWYQELVEFLKAIQGKPSASLTILDAVKATRTSLDILRQVHG